MQMRRRQVKMPEQCVKVHTNTFDAAASTTKLVAGPCGDAGNIKKINMSRITG